MPKASKGTTSESLVVEGYEGHFERFEDGYAVGFEEYYEDTDLNQFFDGLPDDRCQCRHWGYVINGRVGYRFADHEETYEAGDAYYVPPGHTPVLYAGAEVVEFSLTDELDRTVDVVTGNMKTAGAWPGG
jgi:hypothetical protein